MRDEQRPFPEDDPGPLDWAAVVARIVLYCCLIFSLTVIGTIALKALSR